MTHVLKLLLIAFFVSSAGASTYSEFIENKIKYKTYFGNCPSKIAGKLTLELTSEFEKNKSMKDVKTKIIKEDVLEKYYLSDYEIQFNPITRMITFKFECPEPLMKVQIYNKNGEEFYTSILTKDGKLLDPTYEVLLRAEEKLKGILPNLAIPLSAVENNKHFEITQLVQVFKPEFYNKISELILNDESELTLIMSFNDRPSSVFLGKDYWIKKVGQVVKIYDYMKEKKKIPAVINLTNSKKIVVKFPDTI